MIKMIAMDLDGTLLRTDKSISVFSLETLNRCRKCGLKVIYATGRGSSAGERAPSLYFDGRVVMNGAVAYAGENILYNRMIPMAAARGLLLASDARGLKTCAETSGMHYANFDVSREWESIMNYQITDFTVHDTDAEKLYAVITNDADIAYLQAHLPDGLYMTVSRDGLAQIMHREATKSEAIRALAGHWGISMAEVAAFGDDLNDIDMLTACGTGVAMENALEEVKQAAGHVCGDNDCDGVAKWLAEHIPLIKPI